MKPNLKRFGGSTLEVVTEDVVSFFYIVWVLLSSVLESGVDFNLSSGLNIWASCHFLGWSSQGLNFFFKLIIFAAIDLSASTPEHSVQIVLFSFPTIFDFKSSFLPLKKLRSLLKSVLEPPKSPNNFVVRDAAKFGTAWFKSSTAPWKKYFLLDMGCFSHNCQASVQMLNCFCCLLKLVLSFSRVWAFESANESATSLLNFAVFMLYGICLNLSVRIVLSIISCSLVYWPPLWTF